MPGINANNKNIYIEIQGHTDSIGTPIANQALGQARAEAVRRHLTMSGRVALHRMNVISYGESAPVASNMYRPGRAALRTAASAWRCCTKPALSEKKPAEAGFFMLASMPVSSRHHALIRTSVPTFTKSNSSATSSFLMRIQPCEAGVPSLCSSLVPWI